MSILKTADFVGEYRIPKDCLPDLAPYIAKYEKKYLVDLLGSDLYDLFIADLTGSTPQVPQTARFLDIFNEIRLDKNGCVWFSEGIKKMLVQFIYFHFVRDLQFVNTTSGTRRTESQSSNLLGYNGYNLTESYNEGVRNYNVIQDYILENSDTYPEENMIPLGSISGI